MKIALKILSAGTVLFFLVIFVVIPMLMIIAIKDIISPNKEVTKNGFFRMA